MRLKELIKVIDKDTPAWINYLDIDDGEYIPSISEKWFDDNTLDYEVMYVTQDSDNVLTIEVRF